MVRLRLAVWTLGLGFTRVFIVLALVLVSLFVLSASLFDGTSGFGRTFDDRGEGAGWREEDLWERYGSHFMSRNLSDCSLNLQ